MYQPLADLLRPQTLDEVYGQEHILGENGILRRLVDSGKVPNMIFYGPSGTGKTTVAKIIASQTNRTLYQLNATGGIQLIQCPVGLTGDDFRNCSLSGTTGTVENHVRHFAAVYQAAQNAIFAQNMLLSVNLVQCLRPQKIRKWLIHRLLLSYFYLVYHTSFENASIIFAIFDFLFYNFSDVFENDTVLFAGFMLYCPKYREFYIRRLLWKHYFRILAILNGK